jgi:hypothetical protein
LLVSDVICRPFRQVVELANTGVLLGISLKRFCADSGALPLDGRIAVLLSKWVLEWKRHVPL